ncbi:hypothetical protein GCM10025868_09620 [Angustibacter aerolatus]|uniref:FTP domain-containing protein n=1 Tax=Angustibacter aerolatus TaxID=1162965 RepID=A0ABQ6JFM1_9ACTN|nr:hypothetical protein [Angustibacter aerolatus]GMA85712.1 hypothetical protein GCM10025868_09620 [Angustibacter aerolatus]
MALVPAVAADAAPTRDASPMASARSAGHGAAARLSTSTDATVDVRVARSRTEQQAAQRRLATAVVRPGVQQLRDALGSQGVLDVDPLTGTPREVAKVNDFLTGRRLGQGPRRRAAVRAQPPRGVRPHGEGPAGPEAQRDYVDVAGIHHLSWLQTSDGLALFGNGLKANVAKDGRLISVQGSPVANLAAPAALRAPG